MVLYLEDLANPKDNADLIPNFLQLRNVGGQAKNITRNGTGKSDDDENFMEILIDRIVRPTIFVIDSLIAVSGLEKYKKNEILNNFSRTRLIRWINYERNL